VQAYRYSPISAKNLGEAMQSTTRVHVGIGVGRGQASTVTASKPPRRARSLGFLLTWLSVALAGCVIGMSLLAPLLAPYDPVAVDLATGLQAPSAQHWLGTDQLGRDVASRLLWAGRTSLSVTALVALLTVTLGLTLGLVSGYCGGLIDDLAMGLTDLFYALPQIILTLALLGAVGPGTQTMIIALAATGWMSYARLTRSLVLQWRSQEFVLAAHALGAPLRRILVRHLLPVVIKPVLVQMSLQVGGTILTIAGLSFLGLGIQPPTPEWGAMLVDARPYLATALHLVLPPGLAVFLIVLGCNALAERLTQR